jgi:hypothetical protein
MNHHSGFNQNFLRPLILSLVLLLTASLFAQTINSPSSAPNPAAAPKRGEQEFSKKIFWTEVGAYTLFNVLDGYTTIAKPAGFEEAGFPRGSSFLLGKNPSAGRYVSMMGVMQVATSFAAYRLEHSQKRFLRLVGHTLMIQGTYAHADGYIGNLLVQGKTPGVPQQNLASTTPPTSKRF